MSESSEDVDTCSDISETTENYSSRIRHNTLHMDDEDTKSTDSKANNARNAKRARREFSEAELSCLQAARNAGVNHLKEVCCYIDLTINYKFYYDDSFKFFSFV